MTAPIRRIALTGGIATGKSHVLARLAAHGIPTIDADILARHVVAPGTPGLAAVVARFGPGVVDAGGALDRQVLGEIVFADAAARRDLESIIHPAVRRAIDDWFLSLPAATHRFAVADIPLLYEIGQERDFEAVVVTACAAESQVARIIARDRLSEDDARKRVAAQWPIAEKVRRADYVIDTNGSFEETERQVDDTYRQLLTRTNHGDAEART